MVARPVGGAVATVVLATLAAAEPKPTPVDIKPFRDKLVVLKDADGGIYVVANDRHDDAHVFFGTGKILYEQLLEGPRSWNDDAWSVSIQAPRTEYPFMGHVEKLADGTFRKSCGVKQTVGLTQLTGDKAKDILDKSQFLSTPVLYRSYLLARDDRGIYYYVDMLRDQYGGAGHRVFVGKKGAMKQLPLTDVVSDSGGDVFSTKTGDLRLVHGKDDKPTALWIRGEKKNELVWLDTYMNAPLVWRELGIYKISGTICDNI